MPLDSMVNDSECHFLDLVSSGKQKSPGDVPGLIFSVRYYQFQVNTDTPDTPAAKSLDLRHFEAICTCVVFIMTQM